MGDFLPHIARDIDGEPARHPLSGIHWAYVWGFRLFISHHDSALDVPAGPGMREYFRALASKRAPLTAPDDSKSMDTLIVLNRCFRLGDRAIELSP